MGDQVTQHNIGALVDVARASDHVTVTAGGSGNNTLVTGLTIDRGAYASMPRSALFSLPYETTLSANKNLAIAYDVQDSPDGATWTDGYQTGVSTVIASSVAGGTVKGCYNVQVDLNSAMRYVRFNWTPVMSNTATDTAYLDAVAVLGGFDRLPAPN